MMSTALISFLSTLVICFGMFYGFRIRYRLVRIPVTITYGLLLTGEILDIIAKINGNIKLVFIEFLELFIIIGFFATTYYSWDKLEKIRFKKKAVFRF